MNGDPPLHVSPYPESESARIARVEESIRSLDRHLSGSISDMDRRYEQRFELNDKALAAALLAAKEAVAAALIAAKEAVDKAETAAGKRFEATNEFRGQLADQASTFMRQDVAVPQFEAVRREVVVLRDQVTAITGHDSGEADSAADARAKSSIRIASGAVAISFAGVIAAIVIALAR